MKDRSYGLDILKIVSMFFILILHINLRGGLISSVEKSSFYYKVIVFLEIICLCAVNIYGLISGYVSYSRYEKDQTEVYNFKRIIYLWLQVVFYSLVTYTIVWTFGKYAFTYKRLLTIFFPISTKYLWYFSAYALLFLFMPMINSFVKKTDNKMLITLLIFIFIFFSISQSAVSEEFGNFTFTNKGYSVWWLFILFYIGAVIKKINLWHNLSVKKIVFYIIIMYAISYVWKIYCPLFFTKKLENFLFEYISPTHLIISILYVILFLKIKINNNKLQNIIKHFSLATFGVYAMHLHPYIWLKIKNAFVFILQYKIYFVPFIILIVAFILLIIMLVIDIIRRYLFKLLKIDDLCVTLDELLNKILSFIINKTVYCVK